jgi:hypothetical protein
MVTEISGAGANYPVVGQGGATVASNTDVAPESGVAPATTASAGSRQLSQTSRVAGVFSKLLEQQDRLGQAAVSLRDTGQAVRQAAHLLDQTTNNLNQIVKMYPPYPVDDPRRVAILNEVSGLRKEVEALTFPPSAALKLVDQVLGQQPGSAGTSGAQGVEAVVKGGLSGVATLDPGSASDAAVSQALGQVESLQSTLHQVSTGMWQDVVGFVAQAVSPEVQSQGAGTRQQLAGLSDLGLGGNGTLLQQAAESH